MKFLALPLDWKESQNGLIPVDAHLYSLAMAYCKRELAEIPDLRIYRKVWACVQLDQDDKPVKVTGIQALQQVVDLPISRYSDSKAAKLLSERVEIFMQDNGLRGSHVFVYLNSNESEAQRCPAWQSWIFKIWRGTPADRWLVKVR